MSDALHKYLCRISDSGTWNISADCLDLLIRKKDRDAKIVRKKIKELTEVLKGKKNKTATERAIKGFDNWESELIHLSKAMYGALSEWKDWSALIIETREIKKIIKKSHELATLIEKQISPRFPQTHYFFDEKAASETLGGLKNQSPVILFPGFGGELSNSIGDNFINYVKGPGAQSAMQLSLIGDFNSEASQTLPNLLRNVAKYSEWLLKKSQEKKAYHNTEGLEQRIAANYLHDYFLNVYGEHEDGTVAACISLMYADCNITPNADLVRKWTGRR